ncbi:MAG TPA: CPBP family intramembrane glutamic endopeptidase [Terriglobales bacterium]|nr:CPBP family intramembrane glutamic endopeptidase [Terriglobales bacterium]
MNEEILRAILLLLSSITLVGSGVVRRPGIGIIFTLAGIAFLTWSSPQTLNQFGFRGQDSWLLTMSLGFLIGSLLALLATAVIEPLAERLTGQPHDITIVEGVRGNLAVLVRWLIIIWLLVGFLEELIYRGYLMTEFVRLVGVSTASAVASLIFSSAVFGFSHLYQGRSGTISSSIVGLIIGIVFLLSNFNLWLAILIHGVIDTVQLILISMDKDAEVRRWFLASGGR